MEVETEDRFLFFEGGIHAGVGVGDDDVVVVGGGFEKRYVEEGGNLSIQELGRFRNEWVKRVVWQKSK